MQTERCTRMGATIAGYALFLLSVCFLVGYAAQVRSDTLMYQWDPVEGGTIYQLLYQLQWSVQPDVWNTVPPVDIEQAVVQTPDLNPGDEVQARVRAYLDDNGTERFTSEWSETHVYVKAPSAPTNIIVITIGVQVQ